MIDFNKAKPSQDKDSKPKKLFIPTLSSTGSVIFWAGLVAFFSFYGVVVQFHHVHSFRDAYLIFLDFFLVQFCIVFTIVGYIHFSIDYYQRLPMRQQVFRTLFATILLTPPATIIGKVIEFFITNDSRLFEYIYTEIGVNVALAVIITSLLLYYFSIQYQKIKTAQQKYNKRLLEQNEQLKARITPHFFFNMLNTLQQMTETDPKKSVELIENISQLYRVSFTETKEIALTQEIELCEYYISIERHRFRDRLKFVWDLPDEDTLYDMVITSLTLQMIIEKIILNVVENSLSLTVVTIKIRWENNEVSIDIAVTLPDQRLTLEQVQKNAELQLSFRTQTENLQYYFGETANIDYYIDQQIDPQAVPSQLVVQIRYPLVDASMV